jgi:hypothetical protein
VSLPPIAFAYVPEPTRLKTNALLSLIPLLVEMLSSVVPLPIWSVPALSVPLLIVVEAV